jgi:hypothetical protein
MKNTGVLLPTEFHRKTANIALGIGRAAFARHCREAGEHLGLLADPCEDLRLGKARDIVRDGKGAECAGALGVHPSLRNDLAIEMRQLFQEPDVLQQHRPAPPRGDDVVVVDDGCAEFGCELVHGA